jgi:hypothetical protein
MARDVCLRPAMRRSAAARTGPFGAWRRLTAAPPGRQVDHVKAERNVLAEVHNPHVVRLFYSFQARVAAHAP